MAQVRDDLSFHLFDARVIECRSLDVGHVEHFILNVIIGHPVALHYTIVLRYGLDFKVVSLQKFHRVVLHSLLISCFLGLGCLQRHKISCFVDGP